MTSSFVSREVATEFVTSKLGVNITTQDKHEFLSKILSGFKVKIPFQNLDIMAIPFEQREIPAPEECIKCVLEGYGGVCYALNFAKWSLLKALSYDAHLLLGSVAFPSMNDHAVVLVKHLEKEGDNWLVDVGFGSPCVKPINMDFEKESEVITQSHVTYKYEKRGDTAIRLHKVEKGQSFPTIEIGWAHAYYVPLEPKDYRTISYSIDQVIYKRTDKSFFHFSPPVLSFNSNMRAVFFKDGYLLKEGEDGKLHKEDITGDVAPIVHDLFPTIPLKTIRNAMIRL